MSQDASDVSSELPSNIVEDLQIRLAHQEDTLTKLDALVAQQSKELDDTKRQLALVYKKLDDMSYHLESIGGGGGGEVDEAPPHY